MEEDNTQDEFFKKIFWMQDNLSYTCYKELVVNFDPYGIVEIYDQVHSDDIYPFEFKIVKEPKGKKQTDDTFLEEWVDQRQGYEADDFSGEVYLKIKEEKYLMFHYEC